MEYLLIILMGLAQHIYNLVQAPNIRLGQNLLVPYFLFPGETLVIEGRKLVLINSLF